jgi:ribosomal protein S18 acetylase RimI-like enzyme
MTDHSLSITREDDPVYGVGFGPRPLVDPRWRRCSITRNTEKDVTAGFTFLAQWDAYMRTTESFDIPYTVLTNGAGIDEFLESHAPESSVKYGDDEVQAWVGIFDEGEVAGLGAICQWESGGYVLSSIAIHSSKRGRKLGRSLVKAMLTHAKVVGAERVGLGVFAGNAPAIKLYENLGFTLLGQFNAFEI